MQVKGYRKKRLFKLIHTRKFFWTEVLLIIDTPNKISFHPRERRRMEVDKVPKKRYS